MCGIAGYISLDQSPVEHDTVKRMVTALKHRGPDAQTVHLDGPVGFGHARLSIIDLAGGRQPLFNEDRSVTVICNGEIYNYRELRDELIRKGHQFRTGSDCEVIAHLWEESGTRLVDALRGMFAFVLYDNRQHTVFGARDRFGQKPLYYYEGQKHFAFASEIKGLLTIPEVSRDLDPIGLDQFLFYQYIPQPRTLFSEIKRLPAGCSFKLSLMGQGSTFTIHQYWRPSFEPDATLSDAEQLNRVETAVVDAVQSHMVADVPVGVFLSGGIDSSLITAIAAQFNPEPLQTFSISFPGSEHDEGPYARAVSDKLGTNHREFPFQPADMTLALTEAATLFDQPLADMAVLPLLALSRSAAKHVKVVLTGDGGDELFGGYRKYKRMIGFPGGSRWLSRLMTSMFPVHELAACRPDPFQVRKMKSRIAMAIAPMCRSEYQRQCWEGWERFGLYRPELSEAVAGRFDSLSSRDGLNDVSGEAPLNVALAMDQGTVLADRLLLKGDYATMAHGLEARAPLLDHLLADVAARLPLHLKTTKKTTKVALRQLARRHLPAEIVDRRKKGFSMSIDRWFRDDLKTWVRNCLLDESVAVKRYFKAAAIERLLSEHSAGKNHSARIHSLLMFELWCREYAA